MGGDGGRDRGAVRGWRAAVRSGSAEAEGAGPPTSGLEVAFWVLLNPGNCCAPSPHPLPPAFKQQEYNVWTSAPCTVSGRGARLPDTTGSGLLGPLRLSLPPNQGPCSWLRRRPVAHGLQGSGCGPGTQAGAGERLDSQALSSSWSLAWKCGGFCLRGLVQSPRKPAVEPRVRDPCGGGRCSQGRGPSGQPGEPQSALWESLSGDVYQVVYEGQRGQLAKTNIFLAH